MTAAHGERRRLWTVENCPGHRGEGKRETAVKAVILSSTGEKEELRCGCFRMLFSPSPHARGINYCYFTGKQLAGLRVGGQQMPLDFGPSPASSQSTTAHLEPYSANGGATQLCRTSNKVYSTSLPWLLTNGTSCCP